jgi:UDP-glucose 4-epimerase
MRLSGECVVVTGGAGFIGSHVVDRLVSLGADVTVVDDLSAGTRDNLAPALEHGARLVVGDVRDREVLRRELTGARAVFHMAVGNLRQSLADPLQVHEVNATGTLIATLAAVDAGIERFVYVSSSEVYGSAVRTPMTEDDPLRPTTVYGASKAAGELNAQACMRTYGLPVVVVRPFNSYGPREHATGASAEVIPKFVTRIAAGLPPVIFGTGDQTRDFTWVEETASGIVSAAETDAAVGQTINIAFGQGVAIREICERLLELLDAPFLEPEYSEARPGDVEHHWADTTRARELVDFEARVSIDDGLARYVDWALSQPDVAGIGRREPVRNW